MRLPLSLREAEDLLHERGIAARHEIFRYWWHRSGQMFANEIRERWIDEMSLSKSRWYFTSMFERVNRAWYCR
jgi:putative transposase